MTSDLVVRYLQVIEKEYCKNKTLVLTARFPIEGHNIIHTWTPKTDHMTLLACVRAWVNSYWKTRTVVIM